MTEDPQLPPDAELYRRVYEVAHYLWDPIGVSEHPEGHDEYGAYLNDLYGRARAGLSSPSVCPLGSPGTSISREDVQSVSSF